MKSVFSAFVAIALTSSSAGAVSRPRNIVDVPDATTSVARLVSPKFYKSLLISPLEGWIAVRGQLTGDHLSAMRVVRSDLNGEYDALALELAGNLTIMSNRALGPETTPHNVLVELLVYPCADGNLFLSYAHFDEPGGGQVRYYGSAWLAVEKANHLWVTINPRWISPYEHRGPRSYTLIALAPGPAKTIVPRAIGTAGLGANPPLRSR